MTEGDRLGDVFAQGSPEVKVIPSGSELCENTYSEFQVYSSGVNTDRFRFCVCVKQGHKSAAALACSKLGAGYEPKGGSLRVASPWTRDPGWNRVMRIKMGSLGMFRVDALWALLLLTIRLQVIAGQMMRCQMVLVVRKEGHGPRSSRQKTCCDRLRISSLTTTIMISNQLRVAMALLLRRAVAILWSKLELRTLLRSMDTVVNCKAGV